MSWKRFLVVGCSHAQMIDQAARHAVLQFGADYRPQFVAHLGDAIDCTAFMSSANDGTEASGASVEFDLSAGLSFLTEFLLLGRQRVYLHGNHEDRLRRCARSPRAVVAHAAAACIGTIDEACGRLKAVQVQYTGNAQGFMMGDVRLMHGTFFNEQAARDHAEAFGKVMFSHTHRIGIAIGRRGDAPVGYNIGWLGDPAFADYAKTRRATLGWRNAFAWGEFNDDCAVVNLCIRGEDGTWRLP